MEFLINHWLDITTTILGLAYILLEYKASIWMWAVGAVMQILGIVLYYQKGLYADCGMEFYYLAMTAYGWWCWKTKHQTSDIRHQTSDIRHIPIPLALLWTAIFLVLWFAIWWLLTTFTDSTVPIADAFTTAASVAALLMSVKMYMEQWIIWIAVDILTIIMWGIACASGDASVATLIMWVCYLLNGIIMFIKWERESRENNPDIQNGKGTQHGRI